MRLVHLHMYTYIYMFIHRLSEGMISKSFGGDEHTANVEHWTCVHRLTGHSADVMDLAWSPDNLYLASCGLDSVIFIWDAKRFGREIERRTFETKKGI
jgi:WD40 repeat protein